MGPFDRNATITTSVGVQVNLDTPNTIILVLLLLFLYMPLSVIFYFYRRNFPSIRYRNPMQMVICASSACIYCLAQLGFQLIQDYIGCTLYYLVLTNSLCFAILSLFLSQLTLLLTFNLTEMLFQSGTILEGQELKKCILLKGILSGRGTRVIWVVGHILWTMPFIVIVAQHADEITGKNARDCPEDLNNHMRIALSIQVGIIAVLVAVATQFVSKIADNFGLRRAYQVCAYLSMVFIVTYIACTYVNSNEVEVFYIREIVATVGIQNIVFVHILLPLIKSLRNDKMVRSKQLNFRSSVDMLDSYLRDPNGYANFCKFCRLEFCLEQVFLWKELTEYKNGVGVPSKIYFKYIASNAAIPVQNIPGELKRKFKVLFEGNIKYNVSPDNIDDSWICFEHLKIAVLMQMVTDTLPRFQRHDLGKVAWNDFVQLCQAKDALDHVLSHTQGMPTSSVKVQGRVQKKLSRIVSGVEKK